MVSTGQTDAWSRAIAARRRRVARLLTTLSKSRTIGARGLHQLRTNLRRLEAWLDLVGDHDSAAKLDEDVSSLSHLRSMHTLEQWLIRHDASPSDILAVRRLGRETARRLMIARVFTMIQQTLDGVKSWTRPLGADEPGRTWSAHRSKLTGLLALLDRKPKRKRLHCLRLELKQLRYQLEWTASHGESQKNLIVGLKKAQRCLGAHEELASFRKLAKQLELQSRPTIVKAWRRARKRARRYAGDMNWLLEALDRL